VKAAAAVLFSKRAEFPYDWRRVAARKILHKAAEHQATLDDTLSEYLVKAAGFGSTMPKVAGEAIAKRQLMLPESEEALRNMTAKLAMSVAGMNGVPKPDEMVKIARVIDRLDREQGFTAYYDQGVDTPEEMFFGLTEKKANALRDGHFQLTTGTIVPYAALERIPLAKVAKSIGDDFVQRITSDDAMSIDLEKFGQLASTLPRGDASILEKALAAAGALETLPDLSTIAGS
jgi:hypothetical protein